jgi:hypothetical protein
MSENHPSADSAAIVLGVVHFRSGIRMLLISAFGKLAQMAPRAVADVGAVSLSRYGNSAGGS